MITRFLLPVLALVALAFLNVGGCANDGTAGGIGGSGVHGEVNTGTTIDPTTGQVGQVNIGGKVYFVKKDTKGKLHATLAPKKLQPKASVGEGP